MPVLLSEEHCMPLLTLVAVKMVAVHDDARRRQLLRELAALHQLSTVPLTDDARQRALSQDGAMGGRDSEDFSAHRDSRSQKALRAHIVAFHGTARTPKRGVSVRCWNTWTRAVSTTS